MACGSTVQYVPAEMEQQNEVGNWWMAGSRVSVRVVN